jgi:hypothetical protein
LSYILTHLFIDCPMCGMNLKALSSLTSLRITVIYHKFEDFTIYAHKICVCLGLFHVVLVHGVTLYLLCVYVPETICTVLFVFQRQSTCLVAGTATVTWLTCGRTKCPHRSGHVSPKTHRTM